MAADVPIPIGPENLESEFSREVRPLDDDELASLIQQEIHDALGSHLGNVISEQRRENISMYHGKPFGNEQIGRSQAQLTDVADTVEWIMPSLIRMFFGGGEVVRFRSTGKEDEEAARQASDYMNEVFLKSADGFRVGYDWMKTALIEKNSVVKAYYEELEFPEFISLEEVTEVELEAMIEQGEAEITALAEHGTKLPVVNEETGETTMLDTYDVNLRRINTKRRIRVVAIPPEEFLIGRRSIHLDNETLFSAHRCKKTVSDLISMGIDRDLALSLPTDDSAEFEAERSERYTDDEVYPSITGERADAAAREVWVNDCWVRVDADGDGYTELRHILAAGDSSLDLLVNEYATHNPFADIVPIPLPHKWFGLAVADQVKDLQVIRSTLLRQMLDNIYLQNNGRYEVVEGAVEIDDLLSSLPGGIVRVDAPGMVNALPTPQLPASSFTIMEYLEGVKEQRTGITRYNQGTDATSLNKTAFGMGALMEAANQRIELIARIFAEGGFKKLFRIMLRLMIEHPLKDQVVKLRGKWVPVDPLTWNPDWELDLEVGLGLGQAQQRMQVLTLIGTLQREIMNGGGAGTIVTPTQIYNMANEVQLTAGFKSKGFFFQNPEGVEPPPPDPDPQMEKIKQDEVSDTRRHVLEGKKIELDGLRIQQDGEIRRYQADLTAEVERERIASEERLSVAKIEADLERERIKAEVARSKAETGEEDDEHE